MVDPNKYCRKGKDIPKEICDSIRMTLEDARLATVKGIGIGVPGPISPDGKMVVQAVNLDWKDLPLKEIIETDLGIDVCLLNDANAAALGRNVEGCSSG